MLVNWTRYWARPWWPSGGTGESLPQRVFGVGAVRKVILARAVVFRRQALLSTVSRCGLQQHGLLSALLRRFGVHLYAILATLASSASICSAPLLLGCFVVTVVGLDRYYLTICTDKDKSHGRGPPPASAQDKLSNETNAAVKDIC